MFTCQFALASGLKNGLSAEEMAEVADHVRVVGVGGKARMSGL